MATPVVVGVDVGTSSCKAVVTTAGGVRLGAATTTYSLFVSSDGTAEQDPEVWWRGACQSIREALGRSDIPAAAVSAVAVTGQMRGVVLLDEKGEVVRPAISWNDQRCQGDVAAVGRKWTATRPPYRLTPLNAMCTLPKLAWLRRCEPASLSRAHQLLFPKDYVRFRMTGTVATDPSDASGSLFFDVRSRVWLPDVLTSYGIDPSLLPEVLPSTAVVGDVTPAAAADSSLQAGTPVICGASDSVAESLAAGIHARGVAKVRAGTSGAISVLAKDLGEIPDQIAAWCDVQDGKWLADANTRTCAEALAWLGRVAYSDLDLDRRWATIDAEARACTDSSGDVLFMPYLQGEDAPLWNPLLTASLSGLRSATTRAHLARAVVDGVALALYHASSVFDWSDRRGPNSLVLIGGASRMHSLQAAISSAFDRPLRVLNAAEPADGAALLALFAIGEVDLANLPALEAGTTVLPDGRQVTALAEKYTRYVNAADTLDERCR